MTDYGTDPIRRPMTAGDLDGLLSELVAHLRRFVWFSKPDQAIAVALWIVHAHALDAVEQSPVLAITSPVKQSGKSRLVEVISTLVPSPWTVERPSEAVLYRRIERDRPTLLMDEADTIFEDRKGQYEGIRAVFNAGNRRGTVVSRVMPKGKTFDLQDFSIFCAKVVAGIGRFPETIVDRSVVIAMTRRTSGEHVERLRSRTAFALGEPFRERLGDVMTVVTDCRGTEGLTLPDASLPAYLSDRGQDNWEPLLAIADLAGGEWPAVARAAAVALDADRQTADDNAAVTLLVDLRLLFDLNERGWIATAELLDSLHAIESSPWSEWRGGKGLTARGLARILEPFGIKPDRTSAERGYSRSQFIDAWTRFLPPSVQEPSQPSFRHAEPEFAPLTTWTEPLATPRPVRICPSCHAPHPAGTTCIEVAS